MEETAPAAAVCYNVFPALGVDFQGFHISFAHVLVPQLWATTGSFANGKLSIEDVLRYSAILHAAHMANPAHSVLPEKCVHGGETGAVQDHSVGHLVFPADNEDAAKASQVETI